MLVITGQPHFNHNFGLVPASLALLVTQVALGLEVHHLGPE